MNAFEKQPEIAQRTSHAAMRGTTESNKMNREYSSFRERDSNALNTINYPLLDTLSVSFIERAAQKYDCNTGEKDIDAILDEVTASNKQAKQTLTTNCQTQFSELEKTLTLKKEESSTFLAKAKQTANQEFKLASTEVNDQYTTVQTRHTNNVTIALETKEEVETIHTFASVMFEESSAEYTITKTQLSTRETTESTRAATETTRIGRAQASTVENALSNQLEKITLANTTKMQNLDNCAATNTVRKNLIISDRESITKIKALQEKLAALKSRTSSTSTGTENSFLEIHTGLMDNYDEMLQQNLDSQKSWNATCRSILNSLDEDLLVQQKKAQSIRDNAVPKHTLTYDEEVDSAEDTYQAVYDVQEQAVQTAQGDQTAKELTATNAKNKLEEETIKETAAKKINEEETKENEETNLRVTKRINRNADAELVTLLNDMNLTTTDAEQVQTNSKKHCLTAKNVAENLVSEDTKLVNEIQPLLSKLLACKQSKEPAATSLLEVNTHTQKMTEHETMAVQCANTQRRLEALSGKTSIVSSFLQVSQVSQLSQLSSPNNLETWIEQLQAETINIAKDFTTCTEASSSAYATALSQARSTYDADVQQTNDARDQKTETILNTTKIGLIEINQKYSNVHIPYLKAQKTENTANKESTRATVFLSNAVETQTKQVKLADDQKTKSLSDALKLKTFSIEM